MRFIAGVEHIYHVLGRRDDNMLHAFADRFKDFVLDEGENAVTAYVESPTPQKVIPLHTHTHTHIRVWQYKWGPLDLRQK